MHYFSSFPIQRYYDSKKTNYQLITDITLRYKIRDFFQQRTAVYFTYDIKDGEFADIIAAKYYGDSTLDWVIWLVNTIINPSFDWPLSNQSLEQYIIAKYGSVSVAQDTIHHYNKIINEQSIVNNTIIPRRTLIVDLTTYNSLAPADREIVYAYDYEVEVNEKKRTIYLIDKKYIPQLLNEIEGLF
jgi:hypothetical protein